MNTPNPLLSLLGQQQQPEQPPQNWQAPMQLPQQGGVLPQTNPVQGQGDTNDALSRLALQQGQLGTQAFQQAMTGNQQRAQQIQALQQQQQNTPLPAQGYRPQFLPVTGQGFGGDIKNLLGDIGKGALLGLGATGPGRSVEGAIYGPGIREYGAKTEALARQIAELQAEQKTGTESETAASGLAYHAPMALGRLEAGQAALMNAQTKAAYDPARLKLQQSAQELQKKIADGKLTAEQARTQMMERVANIHKEAIESVGSMYADQRDRDAQITAVENEFKNDSEHWFQQLTGFGPTPPSTTPTAPAGPKARGSAVPKTGGGKPTHIWTPQGLQPAGH